MTHEQIDSKLDALKSNLQRLEQIPRGSLEEFVSDFRNVAATIYLLQTSIQALMDLGAYLVSKSGLPSPRTSREIFESLEAAGKLPVGTAARFSPIVAFRNRVVHLYERVDDTRVHDILVNHRSDLLDLFDMLLEAIEKA